MAANTPTKTGPVQDTRPTTLEEMEKKYESDEEKAAKQALELAGTKTSQESLKKNIAIIRKNKDEFEKEGTAQWELFKKLQAEVAEKRACIEHAYPELLAGVGKAITEEVLDAQATLADETKSAEANTTGPADVASREAQRQVVVSQAKFDALTTKSLKDRNTQIAKLVDKVGDIDKDSKLPSEQKIKEKLGLLWLADDRIAQTRPDAETEVAPVPFQFPKNAEEHEKWLVEAYFAYLASLLNAQAAADAHVAAKSDYEAKLKKLTASVGTFEADVLKAAKDAEPCAPQAAAKAK